MNTGLIQEFQSPNDYVSGSSPLVPVVLMPSGDWTPFISTGEPQSKPFETYNCTAFSYTNLVETTINFYIATGTIKPAFLAFLQQYGYLDPDGKVNFSERALGSMSGTTSNGNRLGTVAETARKMGLAPNSLYPFGGANIDQYYQKPPQNVLDVAKRLLDFIDLPYEWLANNTEPERKEALTHCPLYVALCTCNPWFDNKSTDIPWCHAGSVTNHCVCLLKDQEVGDSYFPYVKNLSSDYTIPWSMKVYVQQKENPMIVYKKKGSATLYFACGNVLIAFATNYQDYLVDFKDATIVELPDLSGFKVSSLIVKK